MSTLGIEQSSESQCRAFLTPPSRLFGSNERIIAQNMESIRVDICYRPLRIAWAIGAGDIQGFRSAARTSNALWGGRFNPIIVVDQQEEAQDLVNLFRVDVILPIGDSDAVRTFVKRFPYLVKPFMEDSIFFGNADYGSPSRILDIHNALVHLSSKPEWETIKKGQFRLYTWKPDDSLADVFLMHLGEYPSASEVGIDYRELVKNAAEATEIEIDSAGKLPADTFEHPSISFLSRCGLQRHYSIRSAGWDGPGFYSGDAGNLDDLVTCWNLRAANIPVLFVDPNHLDRYGDTIAEWDKAMRQMVSGRRFDFERGLALWARVDDASNTQDGLDKIMKPFQGRASVMCRITTDTWKGASVCPPMMHFGEISMLGMVGTEFGRPAISFALEKKPFNEDAWFRIQTLVASVSFIGGLYGDEQHTLVPPFVPELNEFYARAMFFHYDKLRIEPGRIGLLVDVSDTAASLYPLSIDDLVERIFAFAGFSSKPSEGGLIARQLIAQLGGVDRARAFKIPGVRRLLKTYSPTAPFTENSALQLIGCRDPDDPAASFKDHENLYIEPRPGDTKLTPAAVFAFLVEKGLFRIGAELTCPNCRLPSWIALDALRQQVVCELCGHGFDATRQLIDEEWRYRRSGVLGKERNAQGAIPVVLTLQQFEFNLGGLHEGMYSTSLDLTPKAGFDLPKCEVDFVWLIPRPYPERTVVMIGECKDRGGDRKKGRDSGTIDNEDIENLRRAADALPNKRFQTFIVLAKLCPFTADEIAIAKTLNNRYRRRVIMLTARELEPLHFFDRTKLEFKDIKGYGHSVEDLANAAATMYFKDAPPS